MKSTDYFCSNPVQKQNKQKTNHTDHTTSTLAEMINYKAQSRSYITAIKIY